MSGTIVLFSVLLLVVAMVSKVVGCGLGAKLCRYTNRESVRIGVGMISRGEVALIVANKGIASGLMKDAFFGPVVIVVIATTILTPILLKLVYHSKDAAVEPPEQSGVLDRYEETRSFDLASQALLEDHETLKQQRKKEDPREERP